jgi:hypothetical protein
MECERKEAPCIEEKTIDESSPKLPKLVFKKSLKNQLKSEKEGVPAMKRSSISLNDPGKFVVSNGKIVKTSSGSSVRERTHYIVPLDSDKENQAPPSVNITANALGNRILLKKIESSSQVTAKRPKVKNVLEFRF